MSYKVEIRKRNEEYSITCGNLTQLLALITTISSEKFISITIGAYKESFIDLEKSNYEKIE